MVNFDDLPQRYGRSLAIAMANRNMTAAQLAEKVGTVERSVQRWTTGEAMPHFVTAMRVFVTLGRPPELNLATLVPG